MIDHLNRSILKYAQYFAVCHPKVIEDEKALDVVLTLDNEEVMKQSTTQPLAAQPPRRGMSIRTYFTTMPAEQHEDRYYGRNNAGRGVVSRIASVRQRERNEVDLYRPYEMGHLRHADGGV
jgi:hypothetical protein